MGCRMGMTMDRRRKRLAAWIGLLVCMLLAAGCTSRALADQPKFEPYEYSTLFEDNTSARPLVAGTVARGLLRSDTHLYAGTVDGAPATELPIPITAEVLARGQDRYNVFCAPCHGADGYGQGIIVQRGFTPPPSLHSERLRSLPPGYYFGVITNGIGAMYSYADRLQPQDRWAVVAYVQALQLSQSAAVDDLPPEVRSQLEAEE